MSATLGKSPPPTGSAAAFQVVVHPITNVHSSCPWYIKAKLGYSKKQKTKAIKQVDNAILFDETFYFERWDSKEIVTLSVWKEKNKLQHVAVASLELACPASKHYPSCTYELKTELFPTKPGDSQAHENRARANTAEGQGVDASKPCGEITISVVHVPGHSRWQQLQIAGASAGEAPATPEHKVAPDGPGNPQQSKKAELMRAAQEYKAETNPEPKHADSTPDAAKPTASDSSSSSSSAPPAGAPAAAPSDATVGPEGEKPAQ